MKVTEKHIQAVLMRWLIIKQHPYIIPNSNQFFRWEADLISIQSNWVTHEYEIKLNTRDFKTDAKKRKHFFLGDTTCSPTYFWYVTYDFEIEPPANAGWLLVTNKNNNGISCNDGWDIVVKKRAPRLNEWKLDQRRRDQIGRILTWRLYNQYKKLLTE